MRAFRKPLTEDRAESEVRGWQAVEAHLPVPALLGRSATTPGRQQFVAFEDVFTSGRCRGLLGDLIAEADTDPALIPEVRQLVDEVCTDWCRAVEHTGRRAEFVSCIPALYADRLQPGGRLDHWYRGTRPPLGLDGHSLDVAGTVHRIDAGALIEELRGELPPDRLWMTALTQGDPTEPNIAYPRCWLDFEHAGRNTIAGEIANLLWYLIALGGWLVPRYQPDVYARTLRRPYHPVFQPALDHVGRSQRRQRFELSYIWRVGPGRAAAIEQLLARVHDDLGEAAGLDPAEPMRSLRALLALRILGVIPASRLNPDDVLLLAIKLAQTRMPTATLAEFATVSALQQEPR